MTLVSRFAPSPTGRLHLGHAYSALRAHDLAKAAGGRFILRIEDIDPGRTREEYVGGIVEDLDWLGLHPEGPVWRQSERVAVYADALDGLRGRGLLYPCFCTRADIAAATSAPHGREGAVYPGTCRGLDPAEAARRIAAGESHAWRLDVGAALSLVRRPSEDCDRSGSKDHPMPAPAGMTNDRLRWHDSTAGWITADPAAHGDVVLARKDAPASYHLAVTIDDAAQGVTDIVRGLDLFAATDVHRLLQALLGLPTPRYHHHPLLTGPDGRRLAKRDNAPTIAALREGGADPMALVRALRRGQVPVGFGLASA
ncbi:tRNA glutamyl-Q(34) synthetase GluQRS [Sphingomonas sp. ID0503]|uniref:tRNA glutamyl-Q(34) synthetase GluQRS n=1 Tax=Sphingomonas sp. ID0503 TaxID=3399691 RepID=UPI003AFB015F